MSGRRHAGRGHVAALSLGALGVVYGDIGTSPLYAFREALEATGRPGDEAVVLGILSLLFWALILVVTVKYLAVVMRADNHGEGGVLALTALLQRVGAGSRGGYAGVILLGLFGTALLYGDGVITPALSVLAAVEGVELATPALGPYVVPIAVAILVALFAVQHFGTAAVGAVFGPVMSLWFATLAALGVWQLAQRPGVLVAVSPTYAADFVVSQPAVAFVALGGVFLVVTGAEALYADLGHFGRRAIELGWFSAVLPALVLNYFGQGALLLGRPAAVADPFYRMAPPWALGPLVVLATLATVIASQALITGAYSLTMQAVQMGYLPRVHITHTSPRQFGQVYLPLVNVALMVGCVALVVGFGSSANLAGAYGMAVTSTMVITTLLLSVVMRWRWGWSRPTTAAVTGGLLIVDVAFFSANVVKIPAGGWVPLVIAVVLFTIFTTWHQGRGVVQRARRLGATDVGTFVAGVAERGVPRVPGTAVYLGADAGHTPSALESNLATQGTLHEHVYVVTVTIADRARVPADQRAEVIDLGQGVCQVHLWFGFMQNPQVPDALRAVVPDEAAASLAHATYFVGRETIVSTARPGMARWRERLFTVLHRNASTIVRYFGLPADRIVEVGAIVEI